MSPRGLIHGPLGLSCLHLCVDMQSLFMPGSPWESAWMARILPAVEELSAHRPGRTVFTRFVPARSPEQARGSWQRYWRKWEALTLERIDPSLVDLVPSLARFVPPARIVDKRVYSPWTEGRLEPLLSELGGREVVITGGETDVCVMATVLGASDRGLRVVVALDAICGSADETHDAAMTLYTSRFSEQVELASTEEILAGWR